jgi:hypothetical protein
MPKQTLAFLVLVSLGIIACRNSSDTAAARGEANLDTLYAPYTTLRGDLHLHSSTGSFDCRNCGAGCETFSAAGQLAAARDSGLDFAALTEHDHDPNQPGSRITGAQWKAAIEAVEQANSPDFVALAGYEWTSSQHTCFESDPKQPDFNHKVVILPPGFAERCDSDVCVTPDQLGEFVYKAGGIILTPHPWRVTLLEGQGAGFPAFVTRNYFDYEGDGPGGVFAGAEVGPDFPPLRWKVLCGHPEQEINSQTGTLAEWQQALVQGKRLAAVSSSDRHFGLTPFGSRTTVLFASDKTRAAILEALQARRTMAANLEPFNVRLAIGDKIVGGTARHPTAVKLRVAASLGEVKAIEVWLGDERLEQFPPDAVNQDLTFSLEGRGPGAVWAKVTGVETDPNTRTPRTTITSPIWVE